MARTATDDVALVAAFRSGQPAAFEDIVKRHYTGLLRVAEQRCGASALAEDAVQAALVRAHRYLQGQNRIENLGAWLRRIVHNCATDLLRTERRAPPVRAVRAVRAVAAAAADEALERSELRALVADAIGRLPAVYQAPLRLRYLHGVEAREIAVQLRDNLNSVKSRIARGRRELRRLLEGVLTREGYL